MKLFDPVAVAFFYHLVSGQWHGAEDCSDREAVERARQVDAFPTEGTHVFRYYGRGD